MRAEQRSFEEIIEKDPRRYLFVAHFGNGDEEDQNVILDYSQKFGKISKLTVFPGTSYGHMEFEIVESAQSLMNDMDGENIKVLKFYGKDRYVCFFYTSVD